MNRKRKTNLSLYINKIAILMMKFNKKEKEFIHFVLKKMKKNKKNNLMLTIIQLIIK